MKKFIRNNIKTFITVLITTIVVGSVSVYAASQYFAKDISFTPTNENFKKENGEAITNVEDALNELYNKKNNCKSGIYHHDGKKNSYEINTNIDYKIIYLSTYVENKDLYLHWYFNSNISNNYYQTHHFGLNGTYSAINKNSNMFKSGNNFIYQTTENNWAEFINMVDVYWVACE